jgi:lysophospholipase L1-like esterase
VRISVLGNSDTTGQKLADRSLSWPVLVQKRLTAEMGRDVSVDSWRFAPYRPGAVDFAMGLVREAQPDIVIYPLATYWCAFTTVKSRVEQRFGRRIANLTSRAETTYVKKFERTGADKKPIRPTLARRVARRVVGTAPILSYERYLDTVTQVIRELAQLENTQVLVMADHHFNETARRAMPQLERTIARVEATVKPLVAERRLLWGSVEDALCAGGNRDAMIMGDCVHVTAEGHERMASALLPVLRDMAVLV